MSLIFIQSLIERNWARLESLSLILAVFYTCVLAAILIDLLSGISKAKKKGELRTSYGLRRTVSKIRDYFSVLMLFTLADVVASVWFSLPFFTAIGTIALVFIEAKSVYENKKDLNKGIKDLPEVLFQILKNKDKTEELLAFLKENVRENINEIEENKEIDEVL